MTDSSQHNLSEETVKIIQLMDRATTLPDGSMASYAENDAKIVLYHRRKGEKKGITYVFDRETATLSVDGKQGSDADKKHIIDLGQQLMEHAEHVDEVTLNRLLQETQ